MAGLIEVGKHGNYMRDVDRRMFLELVHVGPSAVYKNTVRVETFRTIHLCPQTARLFARILNDEADRADRLAVDATPETLSPERLDTQGGGDEAK